jgi:hypothetical protein
VFGILWYRSGLIPKALASLGVFGSALLALGSFAFIPMPDLASIASVGYGYMIPLGIFEVTMGFWLLFKGLSSSPKEGLA